MPTKSILVVGGAGYIGSHMVACLHRSGFTPIILDTLSTGHKDDTCNAELVVGDIHDGQLLDALFSTHSFLSVMHFASLTQVRESVYSSLNYYDNNVLGTLILPTAMLTCNVKSMIFSSSAAVYGDPISIPIKEDHPL